MKFCSFLPILLILFISSPVCSQDREEKSIPQETAVRELVRYLEFTLNTMGNPNTDVREKERIVNESYSKLFESKNVFIEDDLDPNREAISNKYVQGYLKDIDFFFRKVSFSFQILKISSETKPDGSPYFLVEMNRELTGIDSQNKEIHDKRERYVEVNFNEKDNDLKIASIYTFGINEKQMLTDWWQGLSFGWSRVFGDILKDTTRTPSYEQLKKIANLESLDISGDDVINDLHPLELLKNLKELNISSTSVSDVSSLRYLGALKQLYMKGLKITDLSSLTYSNQLIILDVSNTSVSHTSFLNNLVDLQDLNLQGTLVSVIPELTKLSHIRKLNVSNTVINSIQPLEHSVELESLNLEGTNVSDLTPLKNCTNLKFLSIAYSQVTQIETLSSLMRLEELNMMGTAISDISSLTKIPGLKKINCNQSLVKEEGVQEFMKENPGVLIIHDTEKLFNWWKALSKTWQQVLQQHLGISGEPEEIDLARLARLDSLNISGTEITRAEPLLQLPSLKRLISEGIRFVNWAPIGTLLKLETLDIRGSNIQDAQPLSTLKSLREIHIENTRISDLLPLIHLNYLSRIYADDSKVNTDAVLLFLKENSHSLVIYRTGKLISWWSNLSTEWKNYFLSQFDIPDKADSETLHRLTSRDEIVIKGGIIHSLNGLYIFSNLKKLELVGVTLDTYNDIESFPGLEHLAVTRTNLEDLSFLKGLPALQSLDISETPVSTLTPLKELVNLEELNCSGTLIRNLNPLKSLTRLKKLSIHNTRVGNLNPVKDLPLGYLSCFNTRIAYFQIEKFKKEHPDTEVEYY